VHSFVFTAEGQWCIVQQGMSDATGMARRYHWLCDNVASYVNEPRDVEALLGIEGVGAKTLRALALTSELVYGTRARLRDPARYAFAHGGKDGTPFPVERRTYDRTIEVMRNALNRARIDRNVKVAAFRRLAEIE
jgi:hypothetical protein